MQPNSTTIYQIEAFFDPSMALKWPVLGYFHENVYNYDEKKSECVIWCQIGCLSDNWKILYDWATKFRALGFFWFFHYLSLFLHQTNGIDECEKFFATQFNQNTPDWDNFWSVKCSKMTFFWSRFRKYEVKC